MKIKSVEFINQCQSVIQTSYNIVKAHAGKLKVQSKEKEGSVFTITLPISIK